MGSKTDKAVELFKSGVYCSPAVLVAFCEEYGMDVDTASKVSCGLNSGCRCAEICGALSGAILVVGLKYGDRPEICNVKTEELVKAFRDKHGDVTCKGILACDISTPDGMDDAVSRNLFTTLCVDLVETASSVLEEDGY